jgi:uncharacterized membrane-anchored protein YhcB (DUF1043 family)
VATLRHVRPSDSAALDAWCAALIGLLVGLSLGGQLQPLARLCARLAGL